MGNQLAREMASVSTATVPLFPKIDFSGLDLNTSNERWDSARAQVVDALLSHGFFKAVFDEAGPQKLGGIFGEPLKELFAVPIENKMELGHHYINSPTYEVFIIDLESIQSFINTMWPHGNPEFSKTLANILTPLSYLEVMIRKMIFQGLGIGNYYESHLEGTSLGLRLVGYKLLKDHETAMNMNAHPDPNLVSLVYQHDDEGLEIQNLEGQWIRAPPRSIIVFTAESFKALTNGKLTSAVHRVKMMKNDIRYSIGVSSRVMKGIKIDAFEELVDEEHPKLYMPYEYESYLQFLSTAADRLQPDDPLKDFCGNIGVKDKMT